MYSVRRKMQLNIGALVYAMRDQKQWSKQSITLGMRSHQIILKFRRWKGLKHDIKTTLLQIYLKDGSKFYPKWSAVLGRRAHMVPALVSQMTGLKRLWNVDLVKEICWMAGPSLHGNLESALWEAVKVEPALHWRSHYVGNTSAMEHLPRKTS